MVCYEDTDTTTNRFEFREIGPNYPGLYTSETVNSPTLTREERIEEISRNNQDYHVFRNDVFHLTGSLDRTLVYTESWHKDLTDAVMVHFNEIQRGRFHPNLHNLINSNAHGKGINTCFNTPGVLYDPSDAARISNQRKASYIKASANLGDGAANANAGTTMLSQIPNTFNPETFDHNNPNT